MIRARLLTPGETRSCSSTTTSTPVLHGGFRDCVGFMPSKRRSISTHQLHCIGRHTRDITPHYLTVKSWIDTYSTARFGDFGPCALAGLGDHRPKREIIGW